MMNMMLSARVSRMKLANQWLLVMVEHFFLILQERHVWSVMLVQWISEPDTVLNTRAGPLLLHRHGALLTLLRG